MYIYIDQIGAHKKYEYKIVNIIVYTTNKLWMNRI